MSKSAVVILLTLGIAGLAAQNAKGQNFVTNGGFEEVTSSNGGGQIGINGYTATGWSNPTDSYNFVFTAAPGSSVTSADTSGIDTNYYQYGHPFYLWGTNNGGLDALTPSPDGGNFLAADGAYETQALSQTISGLTVGDAYDLSFYWGAAQQQGYYGATTSQWQVSLGDQTQYTPILDNASQSFTGWQSQNMLFTPDSSNETLTFLAKGTPQGVPPFALLDGVSLTVTPEPSSLAVTMTGIAGLAFIVLRRRKATDRA